MNPQSDSTWMATVAAKYATVVSLITPSGSGNFLVVKANPRRWRLQVYNVGFGPTVNVVLPGPVPDAVVITGSVNAPIVSEFPKEPSITTGEWYGQASALTGWIVIECNYLE